MYLSAIAANFVPSEEEVILDHFLDPALVRSIQREPTAQETGSVSVAGSHPVVALIVPPFRVSAKVER